MKALLKQTNCAGGFQFFITENKGNTRFGASKQKAIIEAIQDSNTEGVYQTTTGKIKVQKLNGTCDYL